MKGFYLVVSPSSRKPAKVRKDEKKVSEEELAALRGPAEEAKAKFEAARKEADALEARARDLLAEAKDGYHAALAPYRDACRKAGAACEFEGGRSANVSEKVSFVVEKVEKGIPSLICERSFCRGKGRGCWGLLLEGVAYEARAGAVRQRFRPSPTP